MLSGDGRPWSLGLETNAQLVGVIPDGFNTILESSQDVARILFLLGTSVVH
jgi:hypothetical protein